MLLAFLAWARNSMKMQTAPKNGAPQTEPVSIDSKQVVIRPTDNAANYSGVTIVDANQLANHLGISLRTVANLTHSGAIPSFKIGRCRRYILEDVIATFANQENNTAEQ